MRTPDATEFPEWRKWRKCFPLLPLQLKYFVWRTTSWVSVNKCTESGQSLFATRSEFVCANAKISLFSMSNRNIVLDDGSGSTAPHSEWQTSGEPSRMACSLENVVRHSRCQRQSCDVRISVLEYLCVFRWWSAFYSINDNLYALANEIITFYCENLESADCGELESQRQIHVDFSCNWVRPPWYVFATKRDPGNKHKANNWVNTNTELNLWAEPHHNITGATIRRVKILSKSVARKFHKCFYTDNSSLCYRIHHTLYANCRMACAYGGRWTMDVVHSTFPKTVNKCMSGVGKRARL